MEEIKVGEYVRTRGKIGKLLRIERDDIDTSLKWYVLDDGKYERYVNKPYIEKHSFNIIDLIEVGDYVNGMIIDEFDDVEGNLYLGFPIYDDGLMNSISEFRPLETVEIKSIVTKEQFASMEYRLED